MKTRGLMMLGLALLLAGGSVFLARNVLQDRMQPEAAVQETAQIETANVVVAASRLHFGTKIRREHLRVVDWPANSVPEGTFESVDDLLGKKAETRKATNGTNATKGGKNKKEIPPRVVLRPIEINEPILKSKITGFGGRASLSALISPGMRATTIRVNDVNGVAGFVLPGDRVDILLTRDPNSSGKRRGGNLQTDIFLQNMKVLAIDQDANENRNKPGVVKAVTLEVTPVQAQKLTLAQKLGVLSLALRHVNTVNAISPVSIKARDLRVGEANLAPDSDGKKDEKAVVVIETTQSTGTTTSKTEGVETKTVTKKTKKNMSTIKIVRGLQAKEYEVEPEKPTFSAPAYSKPLNLLPSVLAPAGGTVATAAPSPLAPSPLAPAAPTMLGPTMIAPSMTAPGAAAEDETALESKSGEFSTTEPISLLKSGIGGQSDDDG